MSTDTLAWRFEFMSSTEAVESHFVVVQGAYAPRDIPALEVTDGALAASRRAESRHRLVSIARGRGWSPVEI